MFNTLNIIIYLAISYIFIAPILIIVEKNKIIQLPSNRVATIDGLRGYLALGVLTHHFVVTYYWYRTGIWQSPTENFLNNIGQASVVLFFMITGYLFSRKIKNHNFEIRKFFIKRFFRLMPLLFFIVIVMVCIVFIKQEFALYSKPNEIFKQTIGWLFFIQPNINHLMHTKYIVAGVTWTLRYETIFYLILPILYFVKNIKILFILTLLVIFFGIITKNISSFFLLFVIGYIISEIENRYKNKFNFNNNVVSFINIFIIIFALFYFNTSYSILSFILLGIFFSLLVLGNTLFGILSNKFSIFLGEISYSIYLIHGIILYILFNLLLKHEPNLYHLPIVITVVIFLSLITFKYIEKPFNEFGYSIAKHIKGAS